ncbi:uncharacterized protein LOC117642327 [Thrips palmi]|uniref:Uncharacterized protein LOC117642327 n=1 Tax=Thrips palmi TaxID=161013 RepID=A0A6P8ZK11_THRPL|nr:uncharacterized protein LOC117642327 [Thrips palmi]
MSRCEIWKGRALESESESSSSESSTGTVSSSEEDESMVVDVEAIELHAEKDLELSSEDDDDTPGTVVDVATGPSAGDDEAARHAWEPTPLAEKVPAPPAEWLPPLPPALIEKRSPTEVHNP